MAVKVYIIYALMSLSTVVALVTEYLYFEVFLTVHHSTDLFHLPTLMHNSFIH